MKYFSIDLETTGLDPKLNQILEFAAVFEDTKNLREYSVDALPFFHCYVLPTTNSFYTGSPFALSLNAEILKTIANRKNFPDAQFLYPGEVSKRFRTWLFGQTGVGGSTGVLGELEEPILCAGKNFDSFDRQFILNNLPNFPAMRHRAIDPTVLYTDLLKDTLPPGFDECLKRAGINKSITHKALNDARDIISLFRTKYGTFSLPAA